MLVHLAVAEIKSQRLRQLLKLRQSLTLDLIPPKEEAGTFLGLLFGGLAACVGNPWD
jgi:hypothetical protein